MAEENKSKRQMLTDRMRERYPDMNVDDDEMMSGQIMDDYDNLSKENDGYREREKSFVDLYTSDPKSAYFMESWRKGGDPTIELVRTFGDELREALDDESKLNELEEARKEYQERVAKNEELKAEAEANLEESLTHLKERVDNGELMADKLDDALERLLEIGNRVLMNEFTDEDIDLVLKGMGYDDAVMEADHVGEVRGRNAKIDEKLHKREKGDGVAHLDGKNGDVQPRKVSNSLFSLAKEAQ